MRIEKHNLDGRGEKRCHVYDMASRDRDDYWPSVTDVDCPLADCEGTIRWYEAAYAPGYRICDECKRHFLARGTAEAPILIRVGSRRGCLPEHRAAFAAARAAIGG